MRHAGKLLGWIGAGVLGTLGVIGCQHRPELKPPEEPDVLATPDVRDRRYSEPSQYPESVLASDPAKKALGPVSPITPVRTPKPGGMMTGTGF
jgi:hypothetical protein